MSASAKTELARPGTLDTAKPVRSGAITALEACDATIVRIEALHKTFNAVVALSIMAGLGACVVAPPAEADTGLVLMTDAELAERFVSSSIVMDAKVKDGPIETFYPSGRYEKFQLAMSSGRYWILDGDVCVENRAMTQKVVCRQYGRNAQGDVFEISRRADDGPRVNTTSDTKIVFLKF